uniref:AlNc14C207G8830 protein n=1 Tax=Albugo laibachii Nc14 TaxID=890382 RepID=F0WR22_9STRA|nr:AlNc14C207G8830 [Albugo laibachii Nc14]|eukprot:CCA23782.1 AlNc14C207G8830 [Albugo laibachii Nc14]
MSVKIVRHILKRMSYYDDVMCEKAFAYKKWVKQIKLPSEENLEAKILVLIIQMSQNLESQYFS